MSFTVAGLSQQYSTKTSAPHTGTLDASLGLFQGTELVGEVWSTGFDRVLLYDDATIDGTVACWEAGDAYCTNPDAFSGGVSG